MQCTESERAFGGVAVGEDRVKRGDIASLFGNDDFCAGYFHRMHLLKLTWSAPIGLVQRDKM